MLRLFTRRQTLRGMAAGSAAVVLAACQPKVVEKIVKETVVVKEEVEKEVTTVVEKEVTKVVEKEKIVKETIAVPAERSKVVFWHCFGSGASRDFMDQFATAYNLESANYVVEPVFTDLWTLDQKFTAAVAAGQPPDTLTHDMGRAGQRAEAQQIKSLSAYIAADNFDMSTLIEYGVKVVNYKGEVWGIPFRPDTRILYYNKDQYQEVGLNPDKSPEKWDDLWEYALKLDKIDEAGELQRVGFNPMWGNVYVIPFIYSNGGVPVDDAGEFHLDAPEIIETAHWYKKWVDHYGHEKLVMFASGFGTEASDPFMSGLVSMIVQNNAYIGDLVKYKPDMAWGVGLLPHNGTPASQGAGYDLEIPAGAKNPDGAWDLIKVGLSKDVQVTGARLAGWLPALMEASTDPSLAEVPGWDVVIASSKITLGRKFVLEAPAWYGYIGTAFTEVWDGLKTPEQALADAQAAVLKEADNFRQTHK